jgi:TPR repeat protein
VLSAPEIVALVARADALFGKGDLAAARLLYERAADAGDGQAAVKLGETFDPVFLDHAHLRGVRGDSGTAMSWYRRARDLGTADADILIKSLEAK